MFHQNTIIPKTNVIKKRISFRIRINDRIALAEKFDSASTSIVTNTRTQKHRIRKSTVLTYCELEIFFTSSRLRTLIERIFADLFVLSPRCFRRLPVSNTAPEMRAEGHPKTFYSIIITYLLFLGLDKLYIFVHYGFMTTCCSDWCNMVSVSRLRIFYIKVYQQKWTNQVNSSQSTYSLLEFVYRIISSFILSYCHIPILIGFRM